ncbi:MAG TPA: phosphatase PAP2 family protein [Anaerolineales bacterium]|nr:phosphatase PAP2 family protein [Anaerolineales bacterium]
MNSLLELDVRLSTQMRVAEKPGALRAIAVFFAHSGDSWFWALGLFILWFSSGTFWKQWAVVQFTGISFLAALVLAVKFTVKRQRPEGQWGRVYRFTDPHSFPSGHAARAFLIATVATGLGPAWLAIALWIWAPLVALARVAMGVHYVSDVVAGTFLGILVALIGLQIYIPLFDWLFRLLGFALW